MTKNQSLARPGNKNGVILKDPEARQIAYKDFCRHISEGYPVKAWTFEKDGHRCCWATMMSYIEQDVEGEFDPFLITSAHSAAYKRIYGTGLNMMVGKIQGGSPVIWQTIMRNMFRKVGWDSEQLNESNRSHVESLSQSLRRPDSLPDAEESDSSVERED